MMNVAQLETVVGWKAAAKLAILKSKLNESAAVRMQVMDFAGATPQPGPVGECPECGMQVQEGVIH